jgi:AAA domain (dynein-related subfamily)
MRAAGLKHFAIGNVLSIVASVRGSINPEAATWFKIEKLREAGRKLFDRELFTNPQVRPDDIAAYGQMMRAVFDLLDHDRGWEPVDLFDVQGFLWVALCTPAEWKEDDVSDTKTDAPQSSETANETDQDVLAHFDRSWPGFQRTRDSWFPAQVSAFCAMARAINEAGLDQYESVSYRGSGTPFQLGIKRRGTQRAEKYLGNFTFRASGNYLWLHDSKLTFSLDESSVERFRTDLARLIEDGQIEPVTDRNAYWPDDYNTNDTASCAESSPYTVGSPTNLILYGPPGTGKTYTTAYEAVRLCLGDTDFPDNADGRQTWLATPDRRAELMQLYRELVDDGRIGFVTFHQSYAYEDFVEGLRPPVDTDAVADNLASSSPEAPISSGLKLSVHDGLFKRIADRARLDTGESSAGAGDRLDRTRSVFKIALGRRNSEEAQILQALNEGIIHLGWGGNIDWSDERFDSFNAILDEWQRNEPDATGKNANVEQIYALRSLMQPGDYVVVSDGRDLIRAVGQVTSGYQFKLDAAGYPHRRQVNWLWREDTGIPRDTIYPNWFRQHSLYELNEKVLNWDALDKLVCGTERAPAVDARPYVLVIDEINRGNISKIFGELITLIEPDKRLHPNNANALEVLLPYSQRRWGVPANLHIIGTMNTADRSIALLDTALRRRFTFREMAPRHELLEPVAGIDLAGVLKTINERVEYLLDREHRIGHAFFMGCKDKADVDGVMRDKVIPLLQEYFFEDFARVNAILGDGFIVGVELKAPPGFEAHGKAPKSWSVRTEFDVSAYHALSGKAFEGVANAANANI